jgi:hypothetical protein
VLGLGVDRPGEPEVRDLDRAAAGRLVGEQHVLRLHVAVDHPGPVGLGERGEHRVEQGQRPARRERGVLADHVAQGEPRDVLHDQEERAVVVALVEDRDHVVVREAGRRACLALEPGHEVGVVGEPGVHDLDRHGPVQAEIGGLVDDRHPAAGDPRPDPVPAVEDTPDQRVGGVVHGSPPGAGAGKCPGRASGEIPAESSC